MGRIIDFRSRNLGQKFHGPGAIPVGPQIRIPAPAIASSIVNDPTKLSNAKYGANAGIPPYGAAAYINTTNVLAQIGAQDVRFALEWARVQPTNGAIDWTEYDALFANLTGVTKTVIIQTTGAAWVNGGYGSPFGGFPPYGTTAYTNWVAAYVNFITQAATRYDGLVDMWEVMNEANTSTHFFIEGNDTNAVVNPLAYRDLYNPIYTALKTVNPNNKVSLTSVYAIVDWTLPNGIPGLSYLDTLINTYHLPFDAVSIHPYSSFAPTDDPTVDNYPQNSFKDIGRVQTLMKAAGKGNKELLVSEWGYYQHDDATNAAYLTNSLNLIKNTYSIDAVGPNNAGVTKAHYYHLYNDRDINGIDSNNSGMFFFAPDSGPSRIQLTGIAFQDFMNSLNPTRKKIVTPMSPVGSAIIRTPLVNQIQVVPAIAAATSVAKDPTLVKSLIDNFTGTAALGAFWTQVQGTASSVGGNYQASVVPAKYYRNDYTPDQNVRFVMTLTNVAGSCFGLLRYNPATNSGYKAAALPGSAVVYRIDNGVETAIITVGSITWAANDTLAMSIIGTSIFLYRNGAQIGTIVDSNYTAGGRFGIGSTNTADTYTAFYMTELPVTAILVQPPPAIGTATALNPTASLSVSNQTVIPAPAISTSTALTPNANRSIVAPVAIATSNAVTPSVNLGGGVSDDFAGTGALSAAWTTLNGTPSRVSGEYVGGSGSDIAYRNDFSPGSNQTINITLGSSISGWLVYARMDLALGNGYFLTLTNNSWVVYRFDANVPTGLFSSGAVTFVAGDVVTLKLIGSTIQVLKNGVVDGSGTDATYSAGGRVAIGIQLPGDTIRDFSATSP